MDSNDLMERGFVEWYAFDQFHEQELLAHLPTNSGVYVIRRMTPISRFIGNSDITYIGSTADRRGLRGRIYSYFHPGPTQGTNQRVKAILLKTQDFELSFVECSTLTDAVKLERQLLKKYANEHFELPPLNRQGA